MNFVTQYEIDELKSDYEEIKKELDDLKVEYLENYNILTDHEYIKFKNEVAKKNIENCKRVFITILELNKSIQNNILEFDSEKYIHITDIENDIIETLLKTL
jgi:hypothetical protein